MTVPASGLFTDFYQITMAQGYRAEGLHETKACFDLFFRYNPFGGGYTMAAGLEDALKFLVDARFSNDDVKYLEDRGIFKKDFLEWLKGFTFTGDVYAAPEGAVVFPMTPILRVEAPLAQCQLMETALLNIVNFQSLIATKSARVCDASGFGNVMEFGLRRAHGPDGGLSASRAAFIGGSSATSNTLAGKTFGIPVSGTHAHSWVLAFENELAAFRAYAREYPGNTILLVDTYDTLRSGLPNAVKVGLEMKERGEKLLGVRLDSGDLAYLSAEARKMLDGAGLADVKIVGSGELDEFIIRDLKSQGAKIDVFGVGQNLVTAKGDSAFPGVFKLSALTGEGGWSARMKISDNIQKSTLPGRKQTWRLRSSSGEMMADLLEIEGVKHDFSNGITGRHPFLEFEKKFYDRITSAEPMLKQVMREGKIIAKLPSLEDIRKSAQKGLETLHPTNKRLLNPHIYKVSLGPKLAEETQKLRNYSL
jgi:nicotinate phosphoribosyltransferase